MTESDRPDAISGAVQVVLTVIVAGMLGQALFEGGALIIPPALAAGGAILATGAASVWLWMWRRRRAGTAVTTGTMVDRRLVEVERREAEIDVVHARLAELEERLDFSERLLARHERDGERVRAHE